MKKKFTYFNDQGRIFEIKAENEIACIKANKIPVLIINGKLSNIRKKNSTEGYKEITKSMNIIKKGTACSILVSISIDNLVWINKVEFQGFKLVNKIIYSKFSKKGKELLSLLPLTYVKIIK